MLVWGDGGPPCGVSDSAGPVRFNGPGVFPGVSPGAGRPAVLGLGSLLTGGLLPGLDPLGVLQLQGLLGFGADGRGFWSCFRISRWSRLGLIRARGTVPAGRGGENVRSFQCRWRKA